MILAFNTLPLKKKKAVVLDVFFFFGGGVFWGFLLGFCWGFFALSFRPNSGVFKSDLAGY